jgi:hypothetical protein
MLGSRANGKGPPGLAPCFCGQGELLGALRLATSSWQWSGQRLRHESHGAGSPGRVWNGSGTDAGCNSCGCEIQIMKAGFLNL